MPVLKCSNGKYRIGTGPCEYVSKEKAERAYKGYLGHKYAESKIMNKSDKILNLISETTSDPEMAEAMRVQDKAVDLVQKFADKSSDDLEFEDSGFDGEALHLGFSPILGSMNELTANLKKALPDYKVSIAVNKNFNSFKVNISGFETGVGNA